jgi:hypothetical protein
MYYLSDKILLALKQLCLLNVILKTLSPKNKFRNVGRVRPEWVENPKHLLPFCTHVLPVW